jgi:hypothetical protein
MREKPGLSANSEKRNWQETFRGELIQAVLMVLALGLLAFRAGGWVVWACAGGAAVIIAALVRARLRDQAEDYGFVGTIITVIFVLTVAVSLITMK